MEKYDSAKDTLEHIATVKLFISAIIRELVIRIEDHDKSKLESPEKEYFDKYTPMLSGVTYGSQEYRDMLKEMRPAIEHHHSNNRHHVDFHENGVDDMNLVDLIELIADWKSASLRHDDGDIIKSISIGCERHNISVQLENILFNTVKDMGW